MSTANAAPPVGARFRSFDGDRVLEYIGENLAPQHEGQDRYIVRVVEAKPTGPRGSAVGTEHAVEAKWFETHKELRK